MTTRHHNPPMINPGHPETRVAVVTRNRSLSAPYEHAVGVTADGCEVFTLPPGGLFDAVLKRR